MLRRCLAIIVFTSIFCFAACSRTTTRTDAALSTEAGEKPGANRLLARENLTAARTNALAEFILPEVRARLDTEPGSQDGDASSAAAPETGDTASDSKPSDAETLPGEDAINNPEDLENLKFSWARKKFGQSLQKDPTATGVLVLYADDNYYQVGSLLGFIEEGRDRIAAGSELDPERIKVVYGGYRGLAQVEFWVVPQGEEMPAFKPDERSAANEIANQ